MRKRLKVLLAVLLFALAFAAAMPDNSIQAAKKKSTVTYKLKKGTLTISGKGRMPAKMVFRKNKKIKKVVIKKGVTSVSKEAFWGCKNLKSVSISKTVKEIGWYSFYGTSIKNITIPSGVKVIGQGALDNCRLLKNITAPGKFKLKTMSGDYENFYITGFNNNVETVTFNTKLSIVNAAYFATNNFVVKKDDPLYKDIHGIIYTKSGKGIVRVPSERKKLVIEEGCTDFHLQSVLYCSVDSESDVINGCNKLTEITIPKTVKRIDNTKYFTSRYSNSYIPVEKVIINTNQLDSHSISVLINSMERIDIEDIAPQLPQKITFKNDMYITNDNVLLRYVGKDSAVIIPDGVKWIEEKAFYKNEHLKEIKIPESVTKIGVYAFAYTDLKEINLPSKLTEIPEGGFQGCYKLSQIKIPDSVAVINEEAFHSCENLKKISFGKGLKEIQWKAFSGTAWTELTIPKTITRIQKEAFAWNNTAKKVTIEGSTKYISPSVFSECPKLVLTYKVSPKNYQTCLDVVSLKYIRGGKSKVRVKWNKVSGISGYQIKLSTDKKFKKNVKTVTAKKTNTSKTVTVKHRSKFEYVKIRPYKIVKKKKVYGRWASDKL